LSRQVEKQGWGVFSVRKDQRTEQHWAARMVLIQEEDPVPEQPDPAASTSDASRESRLDRLQEPEPEPETEPGVEGEEEESVEPLAPDVAAECLAAANEAKAGGNEHFKAGKWLWATDAYTEAIEVSEPGRGTPEIRAARAIYFSNRAQARIKMELFEQAEADCSESLKLAPDNVKTLLRRSKAWEGQDKLIEAVDDMKKVVELSPVAANKKALASLEVRQKEQFEKQKEEMMGTLKDLGNKFLGNFGLSTDNFELKEQPGGGYSVNFNQNPGR